MALHQVPGALQSWTTLISTVAQMVDWVHFNTTADAYNRILAPRVARALAAMQGVRTHESGGDVSDELAQLLAPYGWNGERFTRNGNLTSLLSKLKSFKVKPVKHLGTGSYACVRLTVNELTGARTVVKQVWLETQNHGVPVHVVREVSIMRTLSHPHILRLHDVLIREEDVLLALEYLDCDLRGLLEIQVEPLPLTVVKSFTHQMLQALAYANTKRVLHRDLKTANILVDVQRGVVKIADFGLARIQQHRKPGYTQQVVTPLYRAPEIILGERNYGSAVDIWSMGCIVGEMVNSETLFGGEKDIDLLSHICHAMGTPTSEDLPALTEGTLKTLPQIPKPASIAHVRSLLGHTRAIRAARG